MDTLEYVLNKYNLENARGIEIPNVGRNDMAQLFGELGFKSGVEIGVHKGYFSEILCKYNPYAKIYGVDPWESSEASGKNAADKRTENSWSQAKCDEIYAEASERLSKYPNYTILKMYSVDGVEQFADNSLDFVYIDGNHQSEFALQDITLWSKKIRKGGIVSGHDYYNTAKSAKGQSRVKDVVNKYVADHNISPLIIWGLKNNPPHGFRDKWRSWMWIA